MGASFAERLKGGIASGNAAGVGGADIVLKSAGVLNFEPINILLVARTPVTP